MNMWWRFSGRCLVCSRPLGLCNGCVVLRFGKDVPSLWGSKCPSLLLCFRPINKAKFPEKNLFYYVSHFPVSLFSKGSRYPTNAPILFFDESSDRFSIISKYVFLRCAHRVFCLFHCREFGFSNKMFRNSSLRCSHGGCRGISPHHRELYEGHF